MLVSANCCYPSLSLHQMIYLVVALLVTFDLPTSVCTQGMTGYSLVVNLHSAALFSRDIALSAEILASGHA